MLAQLTEEHSEPFSGFPGETLLETGCIPVEEIAELALREGQSSNPLYRVHRWFARRLGTQFRSILTGLSLEADEPNRFWEVYLDNVPLDGAIVLDPFVGGGTSLVEALRCNCRVIGYDIDPVATFITKFELEAAKFDHKDIALHEVCSSISEKISQLHKTKIEGNKTLEVLHHFWVECRTCKCCRNEFEVHPHYRLAYNNEKHLQWVFCKSCHALYELPITQNELLCDCGVRTFIMQGTLNRGKVCCPICGATFSLADRGKECLEPPKWYLFAQEYLERTPVGVIRKFKKATEGDRLLYDKASQLLHEIETNDDPFIPRRPIPESCRSDQRPLIHGFRRYRDLFNDRQLLHLSLLGKAIREMQNIQAKCILAMAFSEHLTTNCMYTAYAFGYRRVSPMFSIHSYRHITRPVEINPWLNGIGRGTYPNSLNKVTKAMEFARSPKELDPQGGRRPSSNVKANYGESVAKSPWLVLSGKSHAAIVTQTSERMSAIPGDSVDIILTDPPYFDNLSYSELSDFYLAWHQSLGIAESPYDDISSTAPISENLALSNRSDKSISVYQEILLSIFFECNRILKSDGIFVFTYHHKSIKAWCAVGEALARSGFQCKAVIPLRGEGQGGLHTYKGTIKWDAVFVCRKGHKHVHLNNQNPIVVSADGIAFAKQKATYYAKRLKKNGRLGFREPDRLNLERALISASAEIGLESDVTIQLRKALEKNA